MGQVVQGSGRCLIWVLSRLSHLETEEDNENIGEDSPLSDRNLKPGNHKQETRNHSPSLGMLEQMLNGQWAVTSKCCEDHINNCLPTFAHLGFDVLAFFWDIAPCSPYMNRYFGGPHHLHLQGRKSAEQETSV
jgi:hypothetical protein